MFHLKCFTCKECNKQLAGGSFYNVDGQAFCEDDYLVSEGEVEVEIKFTNIPFKTFFQFFFYFNHLRFHLLFIIFSLAKYIEIFKVLFFFTFKIV